MKINSIRLKMMIPIILLAIILLCIFVFMQSIIQYENRAMKKQTQSYFEAIAVVLNADRDIYQARLAQEELLTDYGDKNTQQQTFDENAQQVYDRFQKYKKYLSDDPSILAKFSNFENLYDAWLKSSEDVTNAYKAKVKVNSELIALDKQFYSIRGELDDLEHKLRSNVTSWHLDQTTQERLKLYLTAIAKVINADRDLYQARLAQQELLSGIGNDSDKKKEFEQNALQALNRIQTFIEMMADEPDFDRIFFDKFSSTFSEWYASSLNILESSTTQNAINHMQILSKSDKHFDKIRGLIDAAGEEVRKHGRAMEQQVVEDIEFYQRIAVCIIIVGFIFAFSIGFTIPNKITKEVENISNRINEISNGNGDLTARIDSVSKDELGQLSHEFDKFLDQLQSIIKITQEKSSSLGSSTEQLDHVANTINRASDVLVDSCNSIVSASNQMSMANEQMAGVANDTSSESNKASNSIEEGREVVTLSHQKIDELMNNINVTMIKAEELDKNSKSISSVLEVIRGIAEQTNLLALNAAIEAARAGEFGRGFAVVADEVRKLATQTSESTNQIEDMISQLAHSVHEAFEAIKLSKTNATDAVSNFENVISVFDTINNAINAVRDLSEQTALATNEQSIVSNEINQNLVLMKEQTDGVNNASNDIRSQFDTLNTVYQELDEQVSKFKV